MTMVRVHRVRPDGGGPAVGVTLLCEPVTTTAAGRVVPAWSVAAEGVRVPEVVTAVTGADGRVSLDLDPCDAVAGWCWRISERSTRQQRDARYVLVPTAGPVDDDDLVAVDPATLAPVADPEPAWWVALAQHTYLTPADVPGLYLIPAGIAADPDHPGLYLIPTGGA